MNMWRQWQCLITTACLTAAAAPCALGELTSLTSPVLQRTLREHPNSDANKDGVLRFDEFNNFQKQQGAKTNANPLSMPLMNGDLLITDFESRNLGHMRQWKWHMEGPAMGHDLAQGTRLMKRRAVRHSGNCFLTTFTTSDNNTGRLVSPPFIIERPRIEFLLGGGAFPGEACVNLVVSNKVVRSATGRNDDRLERVAFEITEFIGQQATIEIVDNQRDPWGHINVDRIVQTDRQRATRVIRQRPASPTPPAGWMRTLDGRRHTVTIMNDGKLGQEGITADNVLMLLTSHPAPSTSAPAEAVRLRNGELWRVRVERLEKRRVVVHSPAFGRQEVPLTAVATIHFDDTLDGAAEPGRLYRKTGEPIPGRLVWIRDKDIAIDCALGVVPVPRGTVSRFSAGKVTPPMNAPAAEVGLVDGSVLGGTITFEGEDVILEHETLGKVHLKWPSIRSLRRSPETVVWLDQLSAPALEQSGPVLPPPPPRVVPGQDSGFLRSVRMMPHTVARYEARSQVTTLRAELAPLPGSRTDLNVRVLSGGREIWKQLIKPGDAAAPLSVNLPRGMAFALVVDFDGPLAFPCGIDLRDAYLTAETRTTN